MGQVASFAFDPISNRLFGGELNGSGANIGVLAWNNATVGIGGLSNFTLDGILSVAMDITANRLFVAMSTSATVRVYDNISTASGPRSPDFMLFPGNTLINPVIRDLAVHAGALVVTVGGTGMSVGVFIYPGAATLNSGATPIATSAVDIIGAQRAWLDTTGTLYVLCSNKIVIFANALVVPVETFTLQLGPETPTDFIVVE
jgi:hypothetical protein